MDKVYNTHTFFLVLGVFSESHSRQDASMCLDCEDN